MEERLQKLIASAGVCSRRAAETLITAGKVQLNGHVATLGEKADAATDKILIEGKPLAPPEKYRYLLLNKPRGYVTTLSDEQGRPAVSQLVANAGVRVFPIGRLDVDSEGLLLLTNDGDLMQRLLHPKFEINKTYRLWVAGDVKNAALRLSKITDLGGEIICPAEVKTIHEATETALLSITIHEGKNRQIRRMCSACNLYVKRLQRVEEHHLALGALAVGAWRDLTADEVAALRESAMPAAALPKIMEK